MTSNNGDRVYSEVRYHNGLLFLMSLTRTANILEAFSLVWASICLTYSGGEMIAL